MNYSNSWRCGSSSLPSSPINKEKSWKVCVPPRGGVTGHVSETRLQWPPLILVASGIGERTRVVCASHAMRILPSAFCGEEETFTTRGKSTIRSISREERYAFAIKREYQPVLGFSLLGERGRDRSRSAVRKKGFARLLKWVTWMI